MSGKHRGRDRPPVDWDWIASALLMTIALGSLIFLLVTLVDH